MLLRPFFAWPLKTELNRMAFVSLAQQLLLRSVKAALEGGSLHHRPTVPLLRVQQTVHLVSCVKGCELELSCSFAANSLTK